MTMGDKIELQTQPATSDGNDDAQHTIEKLKELIKEYPAEDDKDEIEGEQGEKPSDSEDEYDEDGFKVPSGKIPIDGHFTSKEIEQLVSVAQEEGLIKDDVNVEVLLRDEHFGDKVVIEEKSEEENKDKNKPKNKNGDNEEDELPGNESEKDKERERFKEENLK